jgi:regulator of protease activity HflC (stomatin/prohibitin superfamily)
MDGLFRGLFNASAWFIPLLILLVATIPQIVRVLREYERGVIFRLGKLLGAKGPGLILLFRSWTAW